MAPEHCAAANAIRPFASPYSEADEGVAARLLDAARLADESERRIERLAGDLITAIRQHRAGLGGIEELLHEYSLSTKEGLALMVLAEALLRVPDAATADRLIEDKLRHGDFAEHTLKSDEFLVHASAWALGISARIIRPGETPESILAAALKRLGQPALRTATRQAMRVLGNHFVLGQTIEEELARAPPASGLNFTIDAEEADRLELSLEVICNTLSDRSLARWDGFGLAVQAYQKRAPPA